MSAFVWGLGLGEPCVLKINSTSPVHSKEPAAGTDKLEQTSFSLLSPIVLWHYIFNNNWYVYVCVCVSGFRSYIASMCYSNFMVLTSVCTNCQTASDIVAFLD